MFAHTTMRRSVQTSNAAAKPTLEGEGEGEGEEEGEGEGLVPVGWDDDMARGTCCTHFTCFTSAKVLTLLALLVQ